MTVDRSTFAGNSADDSNGGGGIRWETNSSHHLKVTNSTFVDNSADDSSGGGGLMNNSGIVDVTNSTFASNHAINVPGGAIANYGTMTVTESTLWDNVATGGGGIYGDGSATTTLRQTIVANTPVGGDCAGPVTDGGYNLADDASCAFGATSFNSTPSGLDSQGLKSNGGPTQTIALKSGVAIDVVPKASVTVKKDQRGKPRPNAHESKADIGAYESQ
jgi:hypothetical protein